jgi:hypothetical protein
MLIDWVLLNNKHQMLIDWVLLNNKHQMLIDVHIFNRPISDEYTISLSIKTKYTPKAVDPLVNILNCLAFD